MNPPSMASVQAIVSRANGSIATPVQACSAVHAPGAKGPGLYGSTEGEGHLRKRIPKAKTKQLTSWCPELQTRTPQPKAQGARSSATMQTFLARFERLRSQQRLLVGQVKAKAHNYTVLMKYQAGPQNHFKFCRKSRLVPQCCCHHLGQLFRSGGVLRQIRRSEWSVKEVCWISFHGSSSSWRRYLS